MKQGLAILFAIGGICLGIYVGLWLMFIGGIFNIIHMIDLHTYTLISLGGQVIKILFASPVGWIIAWIGITIGASIEG